MDGDPSALSALEHSLNALFSGSAPPETVAQIQHSLEVFQQQETAWKQSLYFLNHTTNHYAAMYSLTVLENVITKFWNRLAHSNRLALRSSLYQWLLEKHSSVPFFVRNKAIQLVVHIARFDWPNGYPEFFSSIFQLLQSPNPQITSLGLLFLQTTSEELGTPRDDLISERKENLKQKLLQQVPAIFNVLTGILKNVWERQRSLLNTTPPPSPVTSFGNVSTTNSPLDIETAGILRLVFQCLTHLFSWIPLSNHVTPYLLELLFLFVTTSAYSVNHLDSQLPVSVAALTVVNEILYKNCVPADFEDFVILLFNSATAILNSIAQPEILDNLDDMFIRKVCEFLHLLVSSHFRRIERRPEFPVVDFLALFFKFTFVLHDVENYLTCLETWKVVLEHIGQQLRENHVEKHIVDANYKAAVVAVCSQVLRKLSFRLNSNELENIDDEKLDENAENESPWQKFLRDSIEIYVSSAEIFYDDVLALLTEPWQVCTSTYLNLHSQANPSNNIVQMPSEAEARLLKDQLKDLASILQLLGRLCEIHAEKDFHSRYTVSLTLVQRVVEIATHGSKWDLQFAGFFHTELSSSYEDVHLNSLSTLNAWCHWLALCQAEENLKRDSLVQSFVSLGLSAFKNPAKLKANVCTSSVSLIGSVSHVIRTPLLWDSPEWSLLLSSAHRLELPPMVKRQLLQNIFSSALIPWRVKVNEDQHWEKRHSVISTVVESCTFEIKSILQNGGFQEGSPALQTSRQAVLQTLAVLADLALVVKNEGTFSKTAAYSILQQWNDPLLWLLTLYIHDHEVMEGLLTYFLALFDGLLPQMGVTTAEKIVQSLLQLFAQHNIHESLEKANEPATKAVDQFLKILQIVVQQPGAAFQRFLSSTLSLCLDAIYPIVEKGSCNDVKETLFSLLTVLLHNNWRYFFKGSVLNRTGSEVVSNQNYFVAIMTAYGKSLLQSDIALFQQNLQALESLQAKLKLYHKSIFRQMLPQFVTAFLHVLVEKSHDLLREDIAVALYNMASVDFEQFFNTVLPQFISQAEGINDEQKQSLRANFSAETDLPSFSQNIQRLSNDLRCYRMQGPLNS